MSKAKVIFVIGGPGSGKGTQCAKIAEMYGWDHLSSGDLLRAEVASGSDQGSLIQDIINEGGIVPFEITVGLIEDAIGRSSNVKFLIDGFPRTLDQLTAFEANTARGLAMLFFDCSEEVMQERLTCRGRSDDNPETIKKRLAIFREETLPVVESYRTTGRVQTVAADHPVDAVFDEVKRFMDGLDKSSSETWTAHGNATASPVATTSTSHLSSAPLLPDPTAVLPSLSESITSVHEPSGSPLTDPSPPAKAAPALLSSDPFAASAAFDPDNVRSTPPAPAAGAGMGDTNVGAEGMPAAPLDLLQSTPEQTQLALHGGCGERASSVPEPRPVVIMGPSGVGKGTLVKKLLEHAGDKVALTVSHTTRAPRPGEVEGVHYHFTTLKRMREDVAQGRFLEHAEVHGNMYGTSLAAVQAVAAEGKAALLEIDVQGASQVKATPLGASTLCLFVAPPSMEALEGRLRGRGTEEEAALRTRIENARAEMEAARDGSLVDCIVVNDNLEAAFAEVCKAVSQHVGVDVRVRDSVEGDPSHAATSTAARLGEASGTGSVQRGKEGEGLGRERARDYLRGTVVVQLKQAMLALNEARPDDPLQFLIDQLVALKAAQAGTANGMQP